MTTGEAKDIALTELYNRQSEVYRDYCDAWQALDDVADDFTDGSQQTFMLAMRKFSELRDEMWSLAEQMDRIEAWDIFGATLPGATPQERTE